MWQTALTDGITAVALAAQSEDGGMDCAPTRLADQVRAQLLARPEPRALVNPVRGLRIRLHVVDQTTGGRGWEEGFVEEVDRQGASVKVDYDDFSTGSADFPEEGLDMLPPPLGLGQWRVYSTAEDVRELIQRLNARGEREVSTELMHPLPAAEASSRRRRLGCRSIWWLQRRWAKSSSSSWPPATRRDPRTQPPSRQRVMSLHRRRCARGSRHWKNA